MERIDNQRNFLREERVKFFRHMEDLSVVASTSELPLKVLKYLNLHRFGFPLDLTVRYYDGANIREITDRTQELCDIGFEVWTSFATPEVPDGRVSIQRKTPLVKRVKSVADYEGRVGPVLASLPQGTWVKLFYDTHEAELAETTSGAIRITSGKGPMEEREVIVEWANTSDVRLLNERRQYIWWSSTDSIWRRLDPNDPRLVSRVEDLRDIAMVRTIMGGFQGGYRKRMALLSQKEGRESICFEFKMRPGTKLPFFFIDYEYAGEPNRSSFNWFFYKREGD